MLSYCTLHKHLRVVKLHGCLIPGCLVHVVRVPSKEGILLLGRLGNYDVLLGIVGVFEFGREAVIWVVMVLV